MIRNIALTFLLCIFALPAFAEEKKEFDPDAQIVACGTPDTVTVPTDPNIKLCDIYTRQLAYRKERLKLYDSLIERQKNFASPSIKAYQNYQENLVALNEERAEMLKEAKKEKQGKEKAEEENAKPDKNEKGASE